MTKIIISILLILLVTTITYGYTTYGKRILIVDKDHIDLTVMSVMSGAKRVLEQLIIEDKIVIVPRGTKVEILGEYKKDIYHVKINGREGYMVIPKRLLRDKNELHTKAR